MLQMISVIIPVYKVEPYLRKCVDSVLAQTYTNLEVILVDDGSSDNCPAICDEYAVKDSRIKVIHQKNAGVSAARNAGLDAATGTYIGFVDSDDWIEPDMYETMVRTLQKTNSDIACIDVVREREGTHSTVNKANKVTVLSQKEALMSLYGDGCIGCTVWSYLIKSTVCAGLRFACDISVAEDFLFATKLMVRINKVIHLNYTCYHYVIRENSAYHSINEGFWSSMLAHDMMYDEIVTNAPYAEIEVCANNICSDLLHAWYAYNVQGLTRERYLQIRLHIQRYISFKAVAHMTLMNKVKLVAFYMGRDLFGCCCQIWKLLPKGDKHNTR